MLSGLEVYGEHGDCLNSLLSLAVKCAMYLTQNDNAVMAFAQVPNFDMAALETLVTGVSLDWLVLAPLEIQASPLSGGRVYRFDIFWCDVARSRRAGSQTARP
eukprot:TRINITY_DN12615_c1_g2_i3.p3 TRINITY_DN12615_c1_g2~~TRINITY_DN12615_c1_g2_i3.p3  ORF type:complete len:103 (+),score=11.73 TRINITY_DN12615_c1_g2_i3:1981-2289(+)